MSLSAANEPMADSVASDDGQPIRFAFGWPRRDGNEAGAVRPRQYSPKVRPKGNPISALHRIVGRAKRTCQAGRSSSWKRGIDQAVRKLTELTGNAK